MQVHTTSLDTMLQEESHHRPITFLKIDTDGHELQTLKGASRDRARASEGVREENSRLERYMERQSVGAI